MFQKAPPAIMALVVVVMHRHASSSSAHPSAPSSRHRRDAQPWPSLSTTCIVIVRRHVHPRRRRCPPAVGHYDCRGRGGVARIERDAAAITPRPCDATSCGLLLLCLGGLATRGMISRVGGYFLVVRSPNPYATLHSSIAASHKT